MNTCKGSNGSLWSYDPIDYRTHMKHSQGGEGKKVQATDKTNNLRNGSLCSAQQQMVTNSVIIILLV